MTNLYKVNFKEGTCLDQAVLYHKDSSHHIFLKPLSAQDDNNKKYSLVISANDQVSELKTSTTVSLPTTHFQAHNVSMEKIMKKAKNTAASRQLQLLRLSGQIDEFAMRLFMSLSKTVPCRWYFEEATVKESRAKPTAIVIFDEVVINPPYRQEDYFPMPHAAPSTIEWIGKVIERERDKLMSVNQ
jgi:hypothetical protein